jgi:hypothetical protein
MVIILRRRFFVNSLGGASCFSAALGLGIKGPNDVGVRVLVIRAVVVISIYN